MLVPGKEHMSNWVKTDAALLGPRVETTGDSSFVVEWLSSMRTILVRRDMALLEQRTATLDLGEACAACSRPVGGAPPSAAGPSGGVVPRFYLFPTGMFSQTHVLLQALLYFNP